MDQVDLYRYIPNIPKSEVIAYNSNEQSGNAANSNIQFPTIIIDINSEYNNATYVFTSKKMSLLYVNYNSTNRKFSGDASLYYAIKVDSSTYKAHFLEFSTANNNNVDAIINIIYNAIINTTIELKNISGDYTWNFNNQEKGTQLIIKEY